MNQDGKTLAAGMFRHSRPKSANDDAIYEIEGRLVETFGQRYELRLDVFRIDGVWKPERAGGFAFEPRGERCLVSPEQWPFSESEMEMIRGNAWHSLEWRSELKSDQWRP